MRQRFMKGQGLFTSEGHMHIVGAFIIAQNISVPATVLDHPTMENWLEEIKKGYDYIGIAFVSSTYHKRLQIAEAMRMYAPESKIIL